MTTPVSPSRPWLRDLVGLALVAVGGVGLIVCAFILSVLLGSAVLCAALLAAGIYLGSERGR